MWHADFCLLAVCMQMNRDKLMKMAGSVRTGGKGTVRRSEKWI